MKKRIIVETAPEREENGLPEEFERLRLLVEETSDWIWEVDPDLRYTYSSAQVRTILRYEPEEVLGRTPWDFMSPEEATRVRAAVEPIFFARQPIVLFENVVLHRDGHRVTLETSGKSIFDQNGVWRGYIGVSRDITRRRRAEDALDESRRRFATLTDRLHGMAYRRLHDSRGTMEYVSAGAAALTGCPSEDFLGDAKCAHRDFIHPEDRDAVWRDVQKALKQQTPFQLTYRLVSAQGREKWVCDQGCGVFGEKGEVLAVEGFLMDITHHIRTEQDHARGDSQARRLAQLESLSVLSVGVAHEFNNLLTAILGNAEVAIAKTPDASPARNHMEKVCRAALRASELSQQMMAYSGQGGVSLGEMEPHDIIVEAAHRFEAAAPAGCRLEYRIAENLPRLRADPAQLRQALVNLVMNAIEAVGTKEGRVTVSAGSERLHRADFAAMALDEGQAEGRYVWFEVADNGRGMEAAMRQRIFDPFYSTKFTGRGLGLSAVLGIVRAHRGAIRVTSEPGQGSAFRLYFPCAE
ncbi:MAG: PAS domain S-box protein [Verrucomicrobiae bacterium]|nr:PAS domain S-box protein [Verrucomicrobiae bacterium]